MAAHDRVEQVPNYRGMRRPINRALMPRINRRPIGFAIDCRLPQRHVLGHVLKHRFHMVTWPKAQLFQRGFQRRRPGSTQAGANDFQHMLIPHVIARLEQPPNMNQIDPWSNFSRGRRCRTGELLAMPIWKPGRGKLGLFKPLLGDWTCQTDSPYGPLTCTRSFAPAVKGS